MAEDALVRLRDEADKGTLAAMKKKSGVTFAVAAAEWLRWLRDVRKREPSTLSDYRGVVEGYLLPRFGERDVASITAAEIEGYRDELTTLRDDGSCRLSDRTVVRYLVVLHGIFRRAVRVWDLKINPASADLVDRPPVNYSASSSR